jgi:hypothetical protein
VSDQADTSDTYDTNGQYRWLVDDVTMFRARRGYRVAVMVNDDGEAVADPVRPHGGTGRLGALPGLPARARGVRVRCRMTCGCGYSTGQRRNCIRRGRRFGAVGQLGRGCRAVGGPSTPQVLAICTGRWRDEAPMPGWLWSQPAAVGGPLRILLVAARARHGPTRARA